MECEVSAPAGADVIYGGGVKPGLATQTPCQVVSFDGIHEIDLQMQVRSLRLAFSSPSAAHAMDWTRAIPSHLGHR